MPQSIVLLCDNKRRDLPGLALIAHHLEAQGKRVFVEPIEACLDGFHKNTFTLCLQMMGNQRQTRQVAALVVTK